MNVGRQPSNRESPEGREVGLRAPAGAPWRATPHRGRTRRRTPRPRGPRAPTWTTPIVQERALAVSEEDHQGAEWESERSPENRWGDVCVPGSWRRDWPRGEATASPSPLARRWKGRRSYRRPVEWVMAAAAIFRGFCGAANRAF